MSLTDKYWINPLQLHVIYNNATIVALLMFTPSEIAISRAKMRTIRSG